jgi:hypothetical protein
VVVPPRMAMVRNGRMNMLLALWATLHMVHHEHAGGSSAQ